LTVRKLFTPKDDVIATADDARALDDKEVIVKKRYNTRKVQKERSTWICFESSAIMDWLEVLSLELLSSLAFSSVEDISVSVWSAVTEPDAVSTFSMFCCPGVEAPIVDSVPHTYC
jgi:hypothetical protein